MCTNAVLDLGEVTRYSANTHVIPANASVAAELARLRLGGQVVHLKGLLVDGVRLECTGTHS